MQRQTDTQTDTETDRRQTSRRLGIAHIRIAPSGDRAHSIADSGDVCNHLCAATCNVGQGCTWSSLFLACMCHPPHCLRPVCVCACHLHFKRTVECLFLFLGCPCILHASSRFEPGTWCVPRAHAVFVHVLCCVACVCVCVCGNCSCTCAMNGNWSMHVWHMFNTMWTWRVCEWCMWQLFNAYVHPHWHCRGLQVSSSLFYLCDMVTEHV